jgi:hypothetical protein
MRFRAILDQAIEMRRGKLRQRRMVAFDPAKEIAVTDQRDLDRSAMPARFSRAGKRSIKALSLITAHGGAKVPTRFFRPSELTAPFAPLLLRRAKPQA